MIPVFFLWICYYINTIPYYAYKIDITSSLNEIIANINIFTIGSIYFPLLAMRVAEHASEIKNTHKYCLSLLVLASIAQAPFSIAFNTQTPNPCFTMGFAAMAISFAKKDIHKSKKIVIIITLCLLAHTIDKMYGAYGIILTVLFYFYNHKINSKIILYALTIVLTIAHVASFPSEQATLVIGEFGMMLVGIIIITNLNCSKKILLNKRLYYALYPITLLIMATITNYINKSG